MIEEPTLPKLPSISWDERSQSFSNNPRKRVRPQESKDAPPLNYNSSDPAIFSSDDDPALDNYVEGRRKKRYVGSWFQQHPTSSDSTFGSETIHVTKQKRQWTRQRDSGVYLDSDGNESDDLAEMPETSPRSKLPQLDHDSLQPISKVEQVARDKIRACLENGQETVDFWSMGLDEISNETIIPLASFSCIPVVAKDVAFEQKDPELKIYLAQNRLTRVPGALFDLTYLTTLSLRGNKLSELPPAISRLHNLRELNVSQNRLRHLPVELLDLFDWGSKLKTLVLYPNPFFKPEHDLESLGMMGTQNPPTILEFDKRDGREKLIPPLMSRSLGRSPTQLSNTMGRVLSDFRLPPNYAVQSLPMETSNDEDAQREMSTSSQASEVSADISNPTKVPSLLEVALRACYESSQLPETVNYMPDGLLHLRQLLRRSVRQKQAGGIRCSRCRKKHVVSTIEWVEWRELRVNMRVSHNIEAVQVVPAPLSRVEDERAVPFLHRGCSWRCGPVQVEGKRWEIPKGYREQPHCEEIMESFDL